MLMLNLNLSLTSHRVPPDPTIQQHLGGTRKLRLLRGPPVALIDRLNLTGREASIGQKTDLKNGSNSEKWLRFSSDLPKNLTTSPQPLAPAVGRKKMYIRQTRI